MLRRLFALMLVGAAFFMGEVAMAQEKAKSEPLTLGVLLYPGFEILDVFGPVEMFYNVPQDLLKVVMIAEKAGEVQSSSTTRPNGPRVIADYGIDDAPHIDILLVPGGIGTLPELNNEKLIAWIKKTSEKAKITTSVCTGSALLAKAGVLDEHKATTNKVFFDIAVAQGPNTEWKESARWVKDRKMITSSGVSAGIDMALAVIAELFGHEAAEQIAEGTEYVWNQDPENDPFARGTD